MIAAPSNLFVFEAAFRDHLVDRLWDAGIPSITERSIPKNGDQNPLMRTDILIGRYPQIECEASVECKINADSQSLCTGLGQALIYREAFGAARSVICFPRDVMVPGIFLKVCGKHGVTVASDETIVDAVDPDQSLRDSGCFGAMLASLQDFRRRFSAERFDQWPEDALRNLRDDLRPLVDIYNALQH